MNRKFNKKVSYYYDEVIGTFTYSSGHPMKPLRVTITDELIQKYDMKNKMDHFDRDYVEQYMLQVNEDLLT